MKNSRKPIYLFFLLTVYLQIIPAVSRLSADIVHLKQGGSLEGRLTDQGEQVTLVFPGGSIVVKKSDISRIEKKDLPQDIFAARLKQATDAADADACVELARWAFNKDLLKEYVFALRNALLIDPKHAAAEKLLRAYQLHLENLPENETAAQKMLQDMGPDFKLLRSQHFRICYNCTDIFAKITAARIEGVYYEFVSFFQRRNLEPALLTDRLEVILFDTHAQYRAYAQNYDPDMANSSGFYHTLTDRSYFYDSLNDPQIQDFKNQLLQAQERLDKMRREVQAGHNPDIRYTFTDPDGNRKEFSRRDALEELKKQEKELDLQFEKLRLAYLSQNINITVHEATHQLSYACGIFSRYYQNPKWLVEGLALYFEAARNDQWRKPGEIHPQRLKIFLNEAPSPQRLTFEKLITDDEIFNTSRNQAKQAYASAWALFYYLTWQQHEKLFDYIFELSLRISDKPYSAEQRLNDFKKFFGDISSLEAHCRQIMATLPD